MRKYKRPLSVILYKTRVFLASKILGEPIFTDYQEIRHKIINSTVVIKGLVRGCGECSSIKYINIDERCKIISEEAMKLK